MTRCQFHPDEPAVAFAPQSTDLGATVTWVPVCKTHSPENDWWDDADWGPIDFRPLDDQKEQT